MNDDELAVLNANDTFYQAFAGHDYRRMDDIWASERPISCIHPGWSPLLGRGPVMASWHAILRSEGLKVEPLGARAFVSGDSAYVICYEGAQARPPMLVATNVFAREGGAWKMVHHQAGQMSQPPETIASGPTN
jgi:SnoaL-like domain